jgi:hypothetical protein
MWTRGDNYLGHDYVLAEVSFKIYGWCDVKCGLLTSALLHYICNFSVSLLLRSVLWTMLRCTLELCQKILMTAEFSLLAFTDNWVICLDAALYLLICVVCCTTCPRLPMKILNSVLVENWEGGLVENWEGGIMLTASCWHEGSKIRKTIHMAYHYMWQFSGMKRSFICLWDVTLYHTNPHDMQCFTLHQLLFKRHDSVCGPMTYTLCPLNNETAFIMKTQMNIRRNFYGRLLI